MSQDERIHKTLRDILSRREGNSARRRLTIASSGSIDFSSNDFLSLSSSPDLRTAFLEELHKSQHVPLGSGGSRLLDGNSPYMEELEKQIADFHRAPAGLLFNSGFDANSGFFACVPQPGDVIIYDEHIHASVHEGMRLSRAAAKKPFSHNSVQDLAGVLERVCTADREMKQGTKNVFVAVETVYSMDGDVAPLKDILDEVDRFLPSGNGHLIVDEAHATGVYGPNGRGLVCELGLENRTFARLHTFGKALSSGGGTVTASKNHVLSTQAKYCSLFKAIILCSRVVRDYLINYARSLIYTTALGLPVLATVKSAYGLMASGKLNEAQRNVWRLIEYFQSRLQSFPRSHDLRILKETPESPIFSLVTPDPRGLAKHCQSNGFIVRPIVPPTVPEGTQRVRVCLHSGNTAMQIESLVSTIMQWVDEQGQQKQYSSLRTLKDSERARL
ncbi:MAG: hypothetical protein M1831_005043 [Alyxoria varia]|nr:MAG: hypothetical protein M1831_005043 [Alyxoria varia]